MNTNNDAIVEFLSEITKEEFQSQGRDLRVVSDEEITSFMRRALRLRTPEEARKFFCDRGFVVTASTDESWTLSRRVN